MDQVIQILWEVPRLTGGNLCFRSHRPERLDTRFTTRNSSIFAMGFKKNTSNYIEKTRTTSVSPVRERVISPPKHEEITSRVISDDMEISDSSDESIMSDRSIMELQELEEKSPSIPDENPLDGKDDSPEGVARRSLDGENILLHGPGGSGKSHLAKQIIELFNNDTILYKGRRVRYQVLTYVKEQANTFGYGAKNIHNFFGFVPRGEDTVVNLDKYLPNYIKRMKLQNVDIYNMPDYRLVLAYLRSGKAGLDDFAKINGDLLANLIETDILIIDEISNVGRKMFQLMDQTLKKYRNSENPFGGVRLLLVGDMLQTSPVKDDYAFNCSLWKSLKLTPIIFRKIYRFTDVSWSDLLLRMRRGHHTTEDLDYVESLMKNNHKDEGMKICTTRKEVREFNTMKVNSLPGDGIRVRSVDSVFNLTNDARKLASEQDTAWTISKYSDDMSTDDVILLKVGMKVMVLVNNKELRIANGDTGVVMEFKFSFVNEKKVLTHIVVELFNKRIVSIGRFTATKLISGNSKEYNRVQFPLRAAYAATTQKVQGKTQDFITLDYNKRCAAGIAYVGFSRARSPQNIKLLSFDRGCIRCDKNARQYVAEIEDWEGQGFTNEVESYDDYNDYEGEEHEPDFSGSFI